MVNSREIVITGIGVISPIGIDLQEVTESLLHARSGIKALEAPPLGKIFPAGVVSHSFVDSFPKLELPYLDRCQQMAILAARQAIADAGFTTFESYSQRAGLFYGTVVGGAETELGWYRQLLIDGRQASKPYAAMSIMHNGAAAQISIKHQILGPVMTHGSACTSSASAIGEAFRAIRDGYLDVAIAGGADAPLTPAVLGIFEGTRALASPDSADVSRSCKPFSTERAGLVLGEGSVFFVLESADHARSRGVKSYASITGYGIASDGHHIGQPHANGQARAMTAALTDGGFAPSDIDYLNAHATATRGGDEVETNAIRIAFGEHVSNLPVSSTKSIHGHLLGAASAMELAVTVIGLTNSFIPSTANLDVIDPNCSLNHVVQPIRNRLIERAMSFSSGFGGTNVALVISKHREILG